MPIQIKEMVVRTTLNTVPNPCPEDAVPATSSTPAEQCSSEQVIEECLRQVEELLNDKFER